MKRFILTILSVSVFFIGIGSIIEKTSAKFQSDAKALEIINNARVALGGEANLKEVRSMTINASTSNFFEKEGIQETKSGEMEINMQLPGQFSKTIKIGDPNSTSGDVEVRKEVRAIFTDNEGGNVQFTNEDGTKKEGVFIFKSDNGENPNFKIETDKKIKIDGDKIIITHGDGTTEEIKTDGKTKIRVKKDNQGNVITEDITDIENLDGKNVYIFKDGDGNISREQLTGPRKLKFRKHGGANQNELLRTTLSLLMTEPTGANVSYKYLGVGNVDGNTSNIIAVSSNGSSFKLFIDASTNLPQMISYQSSHNFLFIKDGVNNETINLQKNFDNELENQIKFSDFRSVGNVLLPHRWTKSVGGKLSQNIDITSFEINPENISDKFNNRSIFVRKVKSN